MRLYGIDKIMTFDRGFRDKGAKVFIRTDRGDVEGVGVSATM